MKWGVRRYQNADGSLTAAGKQRYLKNPNINSKRSEFTSESFKENLTDKGKRKFVDKKSQRLTEKGQRAYKQLDAELYEKEEADRLEKRKQSQRNFHRDVKNAFRDEKVQFRERNQSANELSAKVKARHSVEPVDLIVSTDIPYYAEVSGSSLREMTKRLKSAVTKTIRNIDNVDENIRKFAAKEYGESIRSWNDDNNRRNISEKEIQDVFSLGSLSFIPSEKGVNATAWLEDGYKKGKDPGLLYGHFIEVEFDPNSGKIYRASMQG